MAGGPLTTDLVRHTGLRCLPKKEAADKRHQSGIITAVREGPCWSASVTVTVTITVTDSLVIGYLSGSDWKDNR
ncbi:MAG: hypothetical protein M1815_004113 [Lichina confinis]|nr:MAG: hypothetical protein M1815_004113 [Lichina confinis]